MTITVADLPAWVSWDEGSSGWAIAIVACDRDYVVVLDADCDFDPIYRASLSDPPEWWSTEKHAEWEQLIPEGSLPPAPAQEIQRGDRVEVAGHLIPRVVVAIRDCGRVLVEEDTGNGGKNPQFVQLDRLTYLGPGDPEVLAAWGLSHD